LKHRCWTLSHILATIEFIEHRKSIKFDLEPFMYPRTLDDMLHEGEGRKRAWNKLTHDQRVAAREASIQLNDRVLINDSFKAFTPERSQGRNLRKLRPEPGESDEQSARKTIAEQFDRPARARPQAIFERSKSMRS